MVSRPFFSRVVMSCFTAKLFLTFIGAHKTNRSSVMVLERRLSRVCGVIFDAFEDVWSRRVVLQCHLSMVCDDAFLLSAVYCAVCASCDPCLLGEFARVPLWLLVVRVRLPVVHDGWVNSPGLRC